MRIAVLALQGAFAEHQQMLQRLDVETFIVRNLDDWNQPKDGLIIPGGEGTIEYTGKDAKILSVHDNHIVAARQVINSSRPSIRS